MTSFADISICDYQQVIELLAAEGLTEAVERINYLKSLIDDDPNEAPMRIASFRHFAEFLLTERHLPAPNIGVSPDGVLQVEWRPAHREGILAMWFLDDGRLQFSGVLGDIRSEIDCDRISGILPMREALDATSLLISKLSQQ